VRFAANLLFQYGVDGKPSARPLCEKRIVVLKAPNAAAALLLAKQYRRRAQYSYRNADGNRFRVRFLGLIDLIDLVAAHDAQEAYFTMFRTPRPERHLRSRDRLTAFASGPKALASSWWAVPAFLVRESRMKSPTVRKPRLARAGRGRRPRKR
jgi:hypothetical protein